MRLCLSRFSEVRSASLSAGKLTAAAVCQTVAARQPAGRDCLRFVCCGGGEEALPQYWQCAMPSALYLLLKLHPKCMQVPSLRTNR